MYRTLYIWVEGDDDVRFFEEIIKPRLADQYDWIEVRAYRPETKEWLRRFLKTIEKMNDDYIFVTDLDSAPCITARKEQILSDHSYLNKDRIRVVGKEIESWYLAGLNNATCRQLKVQSLRTTDSLTKEQFEKVRPDKFDSRRDFMIEVLKYFSIDVAKEKNTSFKYFTDKHGC